MKHKHIIDAAGRASSFDALRQSLSIMHIEMTELRRKGRAHLSSEENVLYQSDISDLMSHLAKAEEIALKLAKEDHKVASEHLIIIA